MTSTNTQSSFQNLSLCVYIGNTSSVDDQSLINYCSQFGTIRSCSIDSCPPEKRVFCDFRIVEFAIKQHLEHFLSRPVHQIGSTMLDIKFYPNLLDNFEILNIDRKLFIGPIINPNDINTITQFYKLIDPTLQYCLSRQDSHVYILIEFSNRQYIRTIIQQQTIPKTIDNQIFTIQTAVHPKEFFQKRTSTRNSQYQICIHGLTEKITETMLIDYFDKRASVIACHRLTSDPTCAIIEFGNEKCTQKLLDTSVVRLYGVTLSLSRIPNYLAPTLSSSTNENHKQDYFNNDQIDELLEAIAPKLITSNVIPHSPRVRKGPLLPTPPANPSVNIQQQEQTNVFSHPDPPQMPMEQESNLSPEVSECGWTSPPRTIISHCLPIDQPSEHLSSKPSTSTMEMNTDSINQSNSTEIDVKPMNRLHFVEQYQKEIDQIKDEYMIKFTRDRTSIEHELNRLMNEERITFEKVNRQIHDYRQRNSTNVYHNRREYS